MSYYLKKQAGTLTLLKTTATNSLQILADKKQLHNEKNLHNPTTIGMYRRIRQTHGTDRNTTSTRK